MTFATNSDGVPTRRTVLGAIAMASLAGMTVAATPLRFDGLRRRQVDANGISIHVRDLGAGPAVLFCHGFPDTGDTWLPQMRAVAAAGYRAIAIDMRGFGLTSAPFDAALYTTTYIVGDLVGVLDALRISSAVLVGHDWGANVGWSAAMMRPDRFSGMLGISVPYAPRGDASWNDQFRHLNPGQRLYTLDLARPDADQRFANAATSIPSVLYWLSASPAPADRWSPIDPVRGMLRPTPLMVPRWADPSYVAQTIASFRRTGFRGGLNYYRAIQPSFELTSAFKGALIRQPTFYVNGAADGLNEIVHPTDRELRDAMPGLRGSLVLDDVGHWVQHEAPEKLNAAIVAFLKSFWN